MIRWREKKLGDVAKFIDYRGKTPRKTESGIPLITAKIVKNGTILPPNEFIAEDDYDAWMTRGLPKTGDVVLTTEAPLGEVAQLKDAHVALAQRIIVLRAKEDVLDNTFLKYFLLSAKGQARLKSRETGTTVTGIKSSELQEVLIPIPALPEQKQIARILSSLDDKIEVNNQINRNLEEQAKAIFKSWFVDFEPFGGEQPDDWETIHFSSFLNPRREKSSDPSIPLFAVTNTGIIPRDSKFKKNLSRTGTQNKVAYKTDMLFGMSREILNWGIMREKIGCISSAYHVFAVSKDIDSLYLELYIQANIGQFRDLIRPAAREGQGLDQQALMSKTLLLPPKDIISAYHDIADPISAQIQNLKSENIALSTLRDTLLPKLMSGEMNIS